MNKLILNSQSDWDGWVENIKPNRPYRHYITVFNELPQSYPCVVVYDVIDNVEEGDYLLYTIVDRF